MLRRTLAATRRGLRLRVRLLLHLRRGRLLTRLLSSYVIRLRFNYPAGGFCRIAYSFTLRLLFGFPLYPLLHLQLLPLLVLNLTRLSLCLLVSFRGL